MQKLIDGFLSALSADGKSPCTTKNYKVDLQQFGAWLTAEKKQLDGLKYADLRLWADGLVNNGLSASSRARKIAAVKSFFRYLFKMDFIDKNPADGLTLPKQEKKQPKVITEQQASNLLEMRLEKPIDGQNKSALWFRDYTILAIFLYTGIRREELTNICLSDVDLEKRQILIHGKGSKQRFVFINDTLTAILSEYLATYRQQIKTAETSKYLLPTGKQDKMCVKTVNDIINKAFEMAGIKEQGISAHILRKRFATSVFQGTGDIATTSKMLGHSSPTVTMRYIVIDEQNMRNAANAVNF